jgi:uncharacterized protein (DUF1810 family)
MQIRLPWRSNAADPHNLRRFLDAQRSSYEQALSEIRSGAKRSHWMWYIFPQYSGLGHSLTSHRYAIKTLAEARAYLEHPILGTRLLECAEAALALEGQSAREVFGYPDDLKLHSSATLFSQVAVAGSPFHRLIDKYFDGRPDDRSLQLIARTGT